MKGIVVLLLLAVLPHSLIAILPDTHLGAILLHLYTTANDATARYGTTTGSKNDLYMNTFGNDELKLYNPEVFRILRESSGISESVFHNCLSPESLECLSDQTDSKSGQAFWRYEWLLL